MAFGKGQKDDKSAKFAEDMRKIKVIKGDMKGPQKGKK
jgi:hypothetical protein